MMRFAAVFTLCCVLFGWVFLGTSGGVGRLLSDSAIAVPVISAMLASVGFGWRRRIVYALLKLWLYLAPAYIADAVGLLGAIGSSDTPVTVFTSLAGGLYLIWWNGFPLLMMVLFIGRTPALLWSRQKDSRSSLHD